MQRIVAAAWRWVRAFAGSLVVMRHSHQLAIVTPVGHGLLAHHYRRGTLVFPTLRAPSARDLKRQTYDSFLWSYVPQPGDTVVDVGAGIGEEAITVSRLVGAAGRVIAIEGQPDTFRRLELVCHLNRLSNVELIQSAVSDRSGTARMQVADESARHIGLALADTDVGVEVPTDTLDRLLQGRGLSRVALLKMNIEGAERLAIHGMQEVLAITDNVVISCHDFLVARGYDPAVVQTFDTVSAFVAAHGFEVESRPTDPLPWNRYNVYGHRRQSAQP